jgi:predicted Zn-dependent protease
MHMMVQSLAELMALRKFSVLACAVMALGLSSCSVNPATGQQQFTALMSPQDEAKLGQSEHPKIIARYGGPFQIPRVEAYVDMVGQRVAAGTERYDVHYTFTVIDSPEVNAFSMPGGFIYVSRGLLTLANSEAELAGVLGHEIGHVTARHSAERYSQSVVAGLGLAVLSAAVNQPGVSRAAGIGSDLALKSYSRTQEFQADELGIRYLSRAGYDPFAVSKFLAELDASTKLDRQIKGKGEGGPGYFATHPLTSDRVAQAGQIATGYPPSDKTESAAYLRKIDGITYGDSARSGFMRGQQFFHPDLGLTLQFPKGFDVENQPDKVLALSDDGTGIIFDGVRVAAGMNPVDYLQRWVSGGRLQNIEPIAVNGMRAATGSFTGTVNNVPAVIRVVAIAWSPTQVYRFQIAMPGNAGGHEEDLKRMTYSLRPITPDERARFAALHIDVVMARANDTVQTLAAQMNLQDAREDPIARFRVLNGLNGNDVIVPGRLYKIVR